ncbi:MAG: ribosome rescue GTPase HflX, partial [Pseudomonadota bacterium]|nr:ribosome rescue GTPase HflX [Pseudomonadota bacterium]
MRNDAPMRSDAPMPTDAGFPLQPGGDEDPFHEIRQLALAAGAEVCATLLSVRPKPHPATFVGKGKAEELAALVEEFDATLVVIDHPVTPIQERNLERIIKCRVLDRTGLILDIFAQRATSREGKLQVELAQLRHLSTRLVRGWTHLERQKGGIGLRGPGETQLETDRRLIGQRIKTLNRRLKRVEAQRSLRRRARHRVPIPTVSLVGYTNSGKSSLFNALTGAGVHTADQFFATLDPTMRRLEVSGYGPVVLSDTVGFIRDLPHELVAAFHSTLEEVANADLLLHLVDYSDPDHRELMDEVDKVLHEIGADALPRVTVYNKIDLTGDMPVARSGADGLIGRVWLSAEAGEGLDLLQEAIQQHLGRARQVCGLLLPPSAGALRAGLYRRCEVTDETVTDEGGWQLRVKLEPADIGWL